ncbi:radical SAM protein [Geothrix sp. 21YS21S-4]|uniref:radical SAM protein n=1 Tax=Geothrix sp. 21YS21S-4 TaxID=3068889 RepID=UPI0027BAB50B|nr:radical SAM protein [Geothrix sp. 21YS21S-4]
MKFKVNEVFHSIQGEGARIGRPCLFIRLSGCPLRCAYCDTEYAFHDGTFRELEDLVEEARRRLGPPRKGPSAPFVELTGGEPLAHPGAPQLLEALLELGHEVALETAGSHDLAPLPREVIKIVDRKTPASGEGHRWLESNLDHMVPGQDELKLVLCDEADYAWAKAWCAERAAWDRWEVLFSPVWGKLDPAWLAERIVADGLPVRMQVQLHKVVWGAAKKGV